MLNQIIIVGRLTQNIEITTTKNERKVTTIILAIPRNYKNENGEYDTDFIPITLWNNIAENTAEYCKKGDVLGVKGRVQRSGNEIEIIAEKVTFLSSNNNKKD